MHYHYTYIITNNITCSKAKHYIGVRTSACHPDNDTYMSSSKYVKNAIKKYGLENFSKKVIRVFSTRYEAIHEIHLHSKHNVAKNEHYYNRTNAHNPKYNIGKHTPSPEDKEKRRQWMLKYNPFRGKKHSTKTKKQMSEKAKGRTPWNKGLTGHQQSWKAGLNKNTSLSLKRQSDYIKQYNPMKGKTGEKHHNALTITLYNSKHEVVQVFTTRREFSLYCKENKIPKSILSKTKDNPYQARIKRNTFANGWYCFSSKIQN